MAEAAKGVVVSATRQGAWHIASTQNFQACSLRSADEAKATAVACERLRSQLSNLCGLTATTWSPRCQIVLHPNAASYLVEVGDAGAKTVASALTRRRNGRVQLRKIDVRGDARDYLATALPHELCHILLAERFNEAPLWCDEGLALLLDPHDKQLAHERDLRAGAERGALLPLEHLLDLNQYPAADQWGVFYGQSASLVRCLLQRGTPQQLLSFAERQRTVGANVALRDIYGFSGIAELNRQWRASLETPIDARLPLVGYAEATLAISTTTDLP